MALTFRLVKGSPLTHGEMDDNFKEFFNSGSVGASSLTLHKPDAAGDLTFSLAALAATSGTIDNVVIGGSTAVAGTFTTLTATALLQVTRTTEQLRLRYDASNYVSFTVSSGGDLAIIPTGGDVSVTGTLYASAGLQNTAIGSVTPAAGAFTTLSATGAVTFTQTGTTNPLGVKAAGTQTNSAATANQGPSLSFTNTSATDGNFSAVDFFNSNNLIYARIAGVATSHGSRYGELHFMTHDGSAMAADAILDRNGNFLLGATASSSNAQLYATKTYSAASGTDMGVSFSFPQSAASTGGLYALQVFTQATHTTGTVASLRSVNAVAYGSGAGGTTTELTGVYVDVRASNASHTITTAYGVHIRAFTATGTITNRWGLYQAGASEINHMAGALRIGTTTATTHAGEVLRAHIATGSTNSAVVISSGDSAGVRLQFCNSTTGTAATDGFVIGIDDEERGVIRVIEANKLDFYTGDTRRMILDGSKNVLYIGDDANANMTAGLTLQQSTADDEIFACKSADVAHAYVAQAETDTYFAIRKSASAGGVAMRAIANDSAAISQVLEFDVYGGQASATKSTSGAGLVNFYVAEHDGANAIADITADGNVFSITARLGGAWKTRLILDEDGDLWITGNLNVAGSTPRAWGSGYNVIGFEYASFMAAAANESIRLLSAGYYDGAYKYAVSSIATTKVGIDSTDGLSVETAAAGTAGNAITYSRKLTVSNLGNVVVGPAALATDATDGFLYITSCAGAPTGVPTAYTGRVAVQYDSTNNKLYIYDGGWIGVTVS